MNDKSARYKLILKTTLALLCLTLIFHGLAHAREVLIPIFFSILIALLLFPITKRLERWHIPRPIAIIVALLVVFSILVLLGYVISFQISNFLSDLPALLDRLNELIFQFKMKIESTFNIELAAQAADWKTQLRGQIQPLLEGSIGMATSTIAALVLIPIYVFLFLYYRDLFRKFLYKLAPKDRTNRYNIQKIITKIQDVAFNYVTGLMIVICIMAVLNSVGLWIVGVPYALFFGVLASLLTIIPYFGIIMGALLPVTVALLTSDSLLTPLGVIIVFSIVQFLEGNFITPKVVGGKVNINPLAAILSLTIGGHLWGIAGMILFIPFIAIVKVIFDAFDELRPFGYLLGTYSGPRKNHPWRFKKYIQAHIEDDEEE